MVKGVPSKVKRGFNRVPFKACEGNQRKRLTSWKNKQRTWTLAGLRALHAPLVGGRPTCFVLMKTDGNIIKNCVYLLPSCFPWFKAVVALVSMMFNIASLDWTEPTDHVELFAGDMSVTRGELKARAAHTA